MKRTSIILMMLSAVHMLASYGQRMVLAYYFGVTAQLDVYFLCLTLPNTLIFFFIALGTAALPISAKFEETGQPEAARELWGGLFWCAVLIVGLVAPLLIWFAGDIISLTGLPAGEQQQIGARLLQILIISQFAFNGLGLMIGNLQTLRGRFIYARLTVLVPFLTLILGVALFHAQFGVFTIALALSVGTALAASLDIFSVRQAIKFSVLRRLSRGQFPSGLSTVFRQALPVMVLSLNGHLLTSVDNVMAAAVGVGALSIFTYTYGIFQIPQMIFTQAATIVKMPDLFKQAARRQHDLFARNIYETIESTLFLIFPATLGLLVLREPLIRLLLERGSFQPETTAAVAELLLYFGPVSILWALWLCLGRPLIALQRAASVMKIELIMTALSIGLNFLLRPWFGLRGLVMSTIFAMTFTIIGFLWIIKAEIKILSPRHILAIIYRSCLAAALMTAICLAVRLHLATRIDSDLLLILIIAGLGGFSYFLAAYLLCIPDARVLGAQINLQARRVMPWLPFNRISPASNGGD